MEKETDISEYREKVCHAMDGTCITITNIIVLVTCIALMIVTPIFELWFLYAVAGPGFLLSIILWKGMFVIEPNVCYVVTFCGKYLGTVRNAGYWYVNPFYWKTRVSLRMQNFETRRIKVNDAIGNPVEL
jgi:hypothetical protein